MVFALNISKRLFLARCYICGNHIHSEHTEGELMKCLKYASNYIEELNQLVDKVLVLNGAGGKFA